jgi:sugar-specific transcriptional regulator TrmB
MASLRDLGLSEYETRAYRALLQSAPTTAKKLSRASEVPMGRIYDVLNSLEQHDLVRSQAASRPKRYVAVEPSTALDRLLADRKRELEQRAAEYEATVEELSGRLEVDEPVEEEFWTAAVGPEETVDLLLERLSVADERVAMTVAEPAIGFDFGEVGTAVTAELERALDRGVRVQVLALPEVVDRLPAEVNERYAERLAGHPEFEVRTAGGVAGTFTVVDEVEVCIEVSNPLDASRALAMIDLKDPEFAGNVLEAFDPRWAEAEPLSLQSQASSSRS